MTTLDTTPAPLTGGAAISPATEPVGRRTHRALTAVPTAVLWAVVILWTIPTLGLLITSLRPEADQISGGWWTIFTDPTLTLDNYRNALFEPPGGTLPFSDAWMLTAVSGALVPNATTVRPMMSGEMPKRAASFAAPRTSASAPITSNTSPPIR